MAVSSEMGDPPGPGRRTHPGSIRDILQRVRRRAARSDWEEPGDIRHAIARRKKLAGGDIEEVIGAAMNGQGRESFFHQEQVSPSLPSNKRIHFLPLGGGRTCPRSVGYFIQTMPLLVSLFDVRLHFTEVNPLEAENPETPACTIVMSPQHFKAFARAVNENLTTYERVFGIINLNANQEALAEVAAAWPDNKKEG